MMRIGLFLGTNLAIIALISLTFRLLGFERVLQSNGFDLNLTALLVYSAVIGFAGSFISLLLSKSMTKASMSVTIIDQPRNETEHLIMETVKSQADRASIAMSEVGIFDHPSPNAFATGWNKNAALVAVSTGFSAIWNEARSKPFWLTKSVMPPTAIWSPWRLSRVS